jgi:hypothetical protein
VKLEIGRSDASMFPSNHTKHQKDGGLSASPVRRSRRWEQQHLDEKVVYRGLDLNLVQDVQRLASILLVPKGEVARSILEFSLRRYEEGFVNLVPRPNPMRMRMTLYPTTTASRRNSMKRKTKTSTRVEPSWRVITTWRNFSPELKRTISALASEDALNVPVGELVNALLRYGLQAHRAGILNLEPVEKATVLTLLGEGDA